MDIRVAQALSVTFVLVGLSHLVAPRQWVAFFKHLFQYDWGPFVIVLYTLPLALLVLFTHNVWAVRPRVLVTIYGWGALLKCTRYLLVPSSGRYIEQRGFLTPRKFMIAGMASICIGVVIATDAFA